jgi:hypothetical protein
MTDLKWGLETQQNVFRKQSNDTSTALRASYRAAHLLAKESKPLSDGELVKKNICSTYCKRSVPKRKPFLIL